MPVALIAAEPQPPGSGSWLVWRNPWEIKISQTCFLLDLQDGLLRVVVEMWSAESLLQLPLQVGPPTLASLIILTGGKKLFALCFSLAHSTAVLTLRALRCGHMVRTCSRRRCSFDDLCQSGPSERQFWWDDAPPRYLPATKALWLLDMSKAFVGKAKKKKL